jgi:hypothetical protein
MRQLAALPNCTEWLKTLANKVATLDKQKSGRVFSVAIAMTAFHPSQDVRGSTFQS